MEPLGSPLSWSGGRSNIRPRMGAQSSEVDRCGADVSIVLLVSEVEPSLELSYFRVEFRAHFVRIGALRSSPADVPRVSRHIAWPSGRWAMLGQRGLRALLVRCFRTHRPGMALVRHSAQNMNCIVRRNLQQGALAVPCA